MHTSTALIVAFILSLTTSWLFTYPVRKLAIKLNILDYPERRKIHEVPIPRLGGLALFVGAFIGMIYLRPEGDQVIGIGLGSLTVFLTGLIDDKISLRPIFKLTGQLMATYFLISTGVLVEKITLPVFGVIELGMMSIPITVLWIIGITNAMNLIDGLDGLATGISVIALLSMLVMAIIDAQSLAMVLCVVLIGANVGFLYHNFYPATIYMGDSGSNFLGFMIAVISILGLFKNITFFSFIIPVIILAVPIFDTLLAIFRRIMNKENIMKADNQHIHYRLIANGYSHRKAVVLLYGFSAIFGLIAILFARASFAISLLITIFILLLLYMIAELAGIVGNGEKPMTNFFKKILSRIR